MGRLRNLAHDRPRPKDQCWNNKVQISIYFAPLVQLDATDIRLVAYDHSRPVVNLLNMRARLLKEGDCPPSVDLALASVELSSLPVRVELEVRVVHLVDCPFGFRHYEVILDK